MSLGRLKLGLTVGVWTWGLERFDAYRSAWGQLYHWRLALGPVEVFRCRSWR